jgi:hypothetical protein
MRPYPFRSSTGNRSAEDIGLGHAGSGAFSDTPIRSPGLPLRDGNCPSAGYRLSTSGWRLPPAGCRLSTSGWRLPPAGWVLSSAGWRSSPVSWRDCAIEHPACVKGHGRGCRQAPDRNRPVFWRRRSAAPRPGGPSKSESPDFSPARRSRERKGGCLCGHSHRRRLAHCNLGLTVPVPTYAAPRRHARARCDRYLILCSTALRARSRRGRRR